MKVLPIVTVMAAVGAGSAVACPWSGGSYEGIDHGLEIKFTVNAACSEITLQSSGNTGFQPIDQPQVFGLAADGKEWKADINGAGMVLSDDAQWVKFMANGNDIHVDVRPVK